MSRFATFRKFLPGIGADPIDAAQHIFDLHWAERVRQGLQPLRWDERCAVVARARADACRTIGRLDHDPDSDGVIDVAEVWDALRLGKRGALGENLGLIHERHNVPERAMELWMGSPTHRANILYRDFTAMGVGYTGGPDERHFIAVVFVA